MTSTVPSSSKTRSRSEMRFGRATSRLRPASASTAKASASSGFPASNNVLAVTDCNLASLSPMRCGSTGCLASSSRNSLLTVSRLFTSSKGMPGIFCIRSASPMTNLSAALIEVSFASRASPNACCAALFARYANPAKPRQTMAKHRIAKLVICNRLRSRRARSSSLRTCFSSAS